MLNDARLNLAKALSSTLDPAGSQARGGPATPHAAIRAAIADSIQTQFPALAGVADELSLGAHPWPDLPTTIGFHRAVVGELNPWLNERHPDVREVVADRLRRLAEVFRDQGLPEDTWRHLERAAATLADVASLRSPIHPSDTPIAVADVIGVGPDVGRQPAADGVSPSAVDAKAVATIVGSVARSGSRDLGTNLGSEPTGTAVDIVIRAAGLVDAIRPFDTWISKSDPRTRDLILERVFTFEEAPTLGQIGTRWGLTRERVRQLEVRAREESEARFAETWRALAVTLCSLRMLVLPTDRFLAACRILGIDQSYPDATAAAVVDAAGPWVHEGGWVHHSSLAPQLQAAHQAVRDSSDEYGLLPADVLAHLDEFFSSDADRISYFRDVLGMVELSGYWSLRDSKRNRVAAALRRIGRPATKTEIASEARVDDSDRLGSTLSGLGGIVRADKERWAFADWVDDPYDGIAAEIHQRISANHGSVAVVSLLEELPRRYGVSETSVHAYLQTPAFVVEDGFVRCAAAGTFAAAPPNKWPDAFVVDELWGQLLRVEDRHLVGYSFKVRFDIAYANGIRPHDELRVPIQGATADASVIWRPHDATKAVDVGRITEVLVGRGLAAGDCVVVCPSRHTVLIADWDESLRPPARETIDESYDGHHDPLFDLLGDG